jgi:hypothetical protein
VTSLSIVSGMMDAVGRLDGAVLRVTLKKPINGLDWVLAYLLELKWTGKKPYDSQSGNVVVAVWRQCTFLFLTYSS